MQSIDDRNTIYEGMRKGGTVRETREDRREQFKESEAHCRIYIVRGLKKSSQGRHETLSGDQWLRPSSPCKPSERICQIPRQIPGKCFIL